MKRIIYSSRAVTDFGDDDLVRLLVTARDHNAARAVTGMLLYGERSFMQMLEGAPVDVDVIYDRVRADPRHVDLRLMLESEVEERMFAEWTMGFEHLDEEELVNHIGGYRPGGTYPLVDPALIPDGEAAERLLSIYAGLGPESPSSVSPG